MLTLRSYKKVRNKNFNEYYELRQVDLDDAEVTTEIESICFPPSEACTLSIMKEHIK